MTLRLTEEQFAAMTGKKKLANKTITTRTVITNGYRSNVKGKRTIGDKTCNFKSLWEIQYAQTLEFQKKNGDVLEWSYEEEHFQFPRELYKTEPFGYIPDFRVTYRGGRTVYIEVKGYMNPASIKKINRFKKHYPDLELEVVSKPWFQKMRRQGMNKIMRWEELPRT